jgi:transcriptional regulator with XRE-family HTH domain
MSIHHVPQKQRRRSRISIPDHVSPHVKLVFAEMRRQGITYDEMEAGAGVLRATVKAWRRKNRPSLESIEAALGFLGFDLVPVPRAKVLPPETVEALRPAVEQLGISMPEAIESVTTIAAAIRERFEPAHAASDLIATPAAQLLAKASLRRSDRASASSWLVPS